MDYQKTFIHTMKSECLFCDLQDLEVIQVENTEDGQRQSEEQLQGKSTHISQSNVKIEDEDTLHEDCFVDSELQRIIAQSEKEKFIDDDSLPDL